MRLKNYVLSHMRRCLDKVFSSQLRAHYAQFLKRSSSLNKLLLHLSKLMPETPVYPGQGSETKEAKTFFTENLSLLVDGK